MTLLRKLPMLRHMRNTSHFDNKLIIRAIAALEERLPGRWIISIEKRQPRVDRHRTDALLEVRGPDGSRTTVVVEAKQSLTAAQAAALAPRLARAARENKAAGTLLVTSFLSPLARERLSVGGVSYLDFAGNARITLDRPALFIESRGADRNPAPPRKGSRSLKGASAARIVRALCDWKPPVGVRELARRADTDPGYATRILTLLEREDVVSRDKKGAITAVNWKDLIRRWAQDYSITGTNQAFAYLEPRSLDAFLKRLRQYKENWALTGSRAVPTAASTTASRSVSLYVESAEQAAADLELRMTDSGANVVLLEPFGSLVWERMRKENGLNCVAVSQCAVDLLTGTGREPSEADALFLWMERNENAWRA